jgi:hypothetical protein
MVASMSAAEAVADAALAARILQQDGALVIRQVCPQDVIEAARIHVDAALMCALESAGEADSSIDYIPWVSEWRAHAHTFSLAAPTTRSLRCLAPSRERDVLHQRPKRAVLLLMLMLRYKPPPLLLLLLLHPTFPTTPSFDFFWQRVFLLATTDGTPARARGSEPPVVQQRGGACTS